ncbi:hypothetical protein B0J11DRAFT_494096 [Dendryphion nanum]|uniref:Uncharacterized protein n=1 Tax=Dendryphion nanum TaxID=256645 RepID=A0A9P9IEC5_9PLEO|nr:hypothetical protein B0J11DRAFT_494096 [Dendryphion nanum]
MPVQHTFMGRPLRLRIPPRRFQLLFILALFIFFALTVYGPPRSAEGLYEDVAEAVKNPQNIHLPSVPKLPEFPPLPNPFGTPSHKPPVQPNSTATSQYGAIQWFQDFKWRIGFSSKVTLDENVAVLPPLQDRPPIYTFYDVKGKQDKKQSEAESRLILAWRRAWWAQGFKPQVLSRSEAEGHPQYQLLQRMRLDKVDAKVELELMRWLAWGYMGGGVLVNWLALPLAEHDNAMLNFLRRKEYPVLSRVESLQNGVFFGEEKAVNEAIKKVVGHAIFKNITASKDKIEELGKKTGGAVVNLLTEKDIAIDQKANGIAYYSIDTITGTYKPVAEKLANTTTYVDGLDMLTNLINAHAHLVFQETFPKGVAIVKPLPEHTTALMYETISIGRNLTQCPSTPLPKSCPPNRPKCRPCDSNKPLDLVLVPSFQNSPSTFQIGTVPHPYTLSSLHYARDTLDENFLRRNAERDQWLLAATLEVLGKDTTAEERIVHFKDIIASPSSTPSSLWLTAERESQADLDWVFGFSLPQTSSQGSQPDSRDPTLVIFPRPSEPKALASVPIPEERWIKNEEERLVKAREAIRSQDKRMKEVVTMVEQWNLADTEAWRFARAWSARRRREREVWEEEEKAFVGSERKSGVLRVGKGKGKGGKGRYGD